MLSFTSSGKFDKTEAWLKRMSTSDIYRSLSRFGDEGVRALSASTPVDSALTSRSWYYEIKQTRSSWSIIWGNRNVVNGVPIAIILQYGHGTGTGGYVQGRDYINPALKPVFDRIAEEAWKEVKR